MKDKVVVVTGAASGIGRAAAILFAQAGAKLGLADWDLAGVEETASLISRQGGEVIAFQVNVGIEQQVQDFISNTVQAFGRLDGAFNNAGVTGASKLFEELSADEWRGVNEINSTGVFYCMKYEILAMRKTGGGAIVNTLSANGQIAEPFAAGYVASKHAALGATRAAAAEARHTGVRVNAILPGLILTPMVEGYLDGVDAESYRTFMMERHSIGRFGRAEEVASVARFLLSDDASFVNGVALPVDGGFLAR